jgi:hypothetical protein
MPEEVDSRTIAYNYASCVSPFASHLGDTAHAGRGGSLHERFSNGTVVDLLAVADWSQVTGGKPAASSVAVRNPAVSWAGDRAIFSMVVGVPSGPTDPTIFRWQLYEITLPTQAQLAASVKPVVTRVANQPLYNNVSPAYGLGGQIIFASDRPYNGQAHLTQLEEYLSLPTVTGLYSLAPATGTLLLLHHAPSGAFAPMVDSYGRVVFTNWDHLSRDTQAVTDSRPGDATYNETFVQTFNGSGNFVDESPGAAFTQVTAMTPNTWDLFPEPRNFDRKTLAVDFADTINGNAQNIFLPWTVNPDGTGEELLNHVGRHEVAAGLTRSFKHDAALVDLNANVAPGYGGLTTRTFFNNLMWVREDPANPGTYFGSDAPNVGTHGAGQIVRLNNAGLVGGAPKNPDGITVTYVTAGVTAVKPANIPMVKPSINLPATGLSPLVNAETLYRTPVPLADGNLVASMAAGVKQTDYNTNTVAQPATLYTFRLRSLKLSGQTWIPDTILTAGITLNTSYYVGSTLVSYSGPAWELDPAEVVVRTAPAALQAAVDPIEAGVFAAAGVDIPTFRAYLQGIGAALTVSRNVTRRDLHDRQQPFNLKVIGSSTQAVGTTGTIYNIRWIQFLQADLRRGYLLGGATPAPGRRVVATPAHDVWSENVIAAGAPAGAVELSSDGSFAAIVPAGKGITWQLLDDNAAKTSIVKERFWVTFQPGEIRTCANCHGVNTSDQTGTVAAPVPRPTNPPMALTTLLGKWKAAHPAGLIQLMQPTAQAAHRAGTITLTVARAGGSTGPASVDYATQDLHAHAGTDYIAASGTLTWADGDTEAKQVMITLAPQAMGNGDFTLQLSNPQFATMSAMTSTVITLADALPPDPSNQGGCMAGAREPAGAGGVLLLLGLVLRTVRPRSRRPRTSRPS